MEHKQSPSVLIDSRKQRASPSESRGVQVDDKKRTGACVRLDRADRVRTAAETCLSVYMETSIEEARQRGQA